VAGRIPLQFGGFNTLGAGVQVVVDGCTPVRRPGGLPPRRTLQHVHRFVAAQLVEGSPQQPRLFRDHLRRPPGERRLVYDPDDVGDARHFFAGYWVAVVPAPAADVESESRFSHPHPPATLSLPPGSRPCPTGRGGSSRPATTNADPTPTASNTAYAHPKSHPSGGPRSFSSNQGSPHPPPPPPTLAGHPPQPSPGGQPR